MKQNLKKLLLLTLSLTMLFACKKDDPQPIEKNFRVKQVLKDVVNDAFDYKITYSYNGMNLIQSIKYVKDPDGNWIENYKKEISYSNNIATEIYFIWENNNWVEEDKTEYKIENELLTEELNFYKNGDTWTETGKWVYQYSNKNLSSWQSYYYASGSFHDELKGEYIYENNKLIQYNEYQLSSNVWEQEEKTIFHYIGDKMNDWVLYNYNDPNWYETSKHEYTYTGYPITSLVKYYWNGTYWASTPNDVFTYSYDGNNCLTKISSLEENLTYEYEEGKGNAKLFEYYPEDLILGAPTFKGKKKHIPYYQRITM